MKGAITEFALAFIVSLAGATAIFGLCYFAFAFADSECDKSVKEHLQLHPARLEYTVRVVENKDAVEAAHQAIYGKPCNCEAFYSATEKLIVIQAGADERILKHEIGHAITDQYFKQPVPRWLHEQIAEEAEEAK